MNFRLIFVIDLLDSMVVHAKRGERKKYELIHTFSSLVFSSDPVQVITAIKPQEIYIADLNKLMGIGSNEEIIKIIRNKNKKTKIMLDYGIRSMEDLEEVVKSDIANNIVLGTETASIKLIKEASSSLLKARNHQRRSKESSISVSVDLFRKKLLTRDKIMKTDLFLLIKELNNYPLKNIIVMELDRVGMKSGLDFDLLARAVEVSEHGILCGGGVRNCVDIEKLEKIGVKGALVATAIHDGSIPKSLLRK